MAETNDTVTRNEKAAPFASFSLLMDAHSQLLQREPDVNEKSTYLTEVQEFFDRAQATGAVLDNEDERRTAQSILNYWITVLYRANVGKPDNTTLALFNPRLILPMDDAQCPYPGVRAFREDENKFFFGRQRQINYMLGRLREDRLLAIVGPSGSGKTSLVLAGLLPEMKRDDKLNNTERYYFPIITPGSRPMENLERMFHLSDNVRHEAGARQTMDSRQGSYQLVNQIELFTKLPAVIVVDQFEEVFTRANDKDRRAFMANLGRVIQSQQARHIVILTMRDDDYDSYLPKPERFRRVLDPAKVSLPQLGSLELREAIEKPGAYVGLDFDELTIEILVKEIISVPVGLPLLQFTLLKLWVIHKKNEDINEAFKQTGCARSLLANSAEEFYKKLDFREQRLCKRLFTDLITIDSDLKAYSYPVARGDLYRKTENKARVDSLIGNLASEQLLRLNPGGVPADDEVELVHDSLIRSWPRMAEWVASKRKKRRWGRIAAGVAFAGLVFLVLLLGALAWGQKKQSDQSRDLARLSNKQFGYDRFDLAMLFGGEAYKVEANATTRSNLLKLLYSLQSTSHPKIFLDKENFEAEDLVFSAESADNPSKLAAIDHDGNIVIWNLNSRMIERTLVSENIATFPLAFSPDGKRLATASLDQAVTLILWDLENGQRTDLTQEPKAFPITSLTFSPDSKSLLTGSDNGSVIKWDDLAGNEIKTTLLYQHSDTVRTVAFDATGDLLASGSTDGTVILLDQRVEGGRRRTFAVHAEVKGTQPGTESKEIFSLAFKNKDDELAAGSGDEVFIWNIATRKLVDEFCSGPVPLGNLVSFGEGGDLLTAFGFDGSLILWDVKAREAVGRQFYKPAATYSAAFSGNGKFLAFPGQDGVVVWDVFSERILPVGSTVNSLAFSPTTDNQIMASGGGDGTLILWKAPNTEHHERLGPPIKEESGVSSLAFSEGGRLLAVGLQNGTISVRDPKDYSQINVLDAQTGKLVKRSASASWDAQSPPVSVSKVIFDPSRGSSRLAALVVVQPQETETLNAADQGDLPTKVILWNGIDAPTGTEPTSKVVPTEAGRIVTSMAFSSDGKILALGTASPSSSGGNGKQNFTIVLWQEGETEPAKLSCEERVSSIAFSRQRILAAGLENGKIFLWDLATRKRINDNPMEASAGRVTDLAFSPDGMTLAAVTNKKLQHKQPGVITLWDVETREPIGNPLVGHKGPVSAIAFSADGKMLASGSGEENSSGYESQHSIVLWDLDIEGAGDRFCEIVNCRLQRPEVADQVNNKSVFQRLYHNVSLGLKRLGLAIRN
jgi:WD40 repeat protein/energy-coupling factor transporter ATP-binding protein EcfA2